MDTMPTEKHEAAWLALESELTAIDWGKVHGLFSLMGYRWRDNPEPPSEADLRNMARQLAGQAIASIADDYDADDRNSASVSSGRLKVSLTEFHGGSWGADVSFQLRSLT